MITLIPRETGAAPDPPDPRERRRALQARALPAVTGSGSEARPSALESVAFPGRSFQTRETTAPPHGGRSSRERDRVPHRRGTHPGRLLTPVALGCPTGATLGSRVGVKRVSAEIPRIFPTLHLSCKSLLFLVGLPGLEPGASSSSGSSARFRPLAPSPHIPLLTASSSPGHEPSIRWMSRSVGRVGVSIGVKAVRYRSHGSTEKVRRADPNR